jgi:hypothetical protein
VRIGPPSLDRSIRGLPEANIWRDVEGRIIAFLFRRLGKIGICFPEFASYIFPEDRDQQLIEILVEPGQAATREQIFDQLRRNVVPLILQSRGFQVLHASAVMLCGGVVAFSGRSLSGKSTLAFALSRRGYDVWTDDALLVGVTADGVQTFKGPSTRLRLRADSNEYFGEMNSGSEAVDDVEFEFSLCAPNVAPLKALYMIHRIQGWGTQRELWSCERVAGPQAFKMVLNQANYFDLAHAPERRRIAETCLCLALKVPIYNCRYQHGFDVVERVIDEIETSLSGFDGPLPSDPCTNPTLHI